MKPIHKLYIKAFLIMGLLFASLMTLMAILEGETPNMVKFIIQASLLGGILSTILVSMHKYYLNEKGITDPTEENLSVVQQTEFLSKVSQEDFIKKLSEHVVASGMTLNTEDDTIILNSGITWKSLGERIEIKIKPISEGKFKYHVISKPNLSTTLFDFGKSIENISMIESMAKTQK